MRVRTDSGTRRIAAGLIVLAGGALVLGLSACGLFDIRDRVSPTIIDARCQGDQPTSSDIALSNFALSIECRKQGSGLFSQSTTDGFWLVLDATSVHDLELLGVPRDSINHAEVITAQDRINNSAEFPDSFKFVFTPVVPQDLGGGKVFYESMPYRLEMYQPEGDTARLTTQYAGETDLTVSEQQAGTWAISRWVDYRVTGGSDVLPLGYLYALKALTPG